jgi:carnosine N-methyltransferase
VVIGLILVCLALPPYLLMVQMSCYLLGPLLYHFSDMSNEHSVELSYEMIHRLILDYGFELVKEEARMPSSYIQSPWSMMKLQYECVFFVARKPVGSR